MGNYSDDRPPFDEDTAHFLEEVNFHARAKSAAIKATLGFLLGFGVTIIIGYTLGNPATGICLGLPIGVACGYGLARLTT